MSDQFWWRCYNKKDKSKPKIKIKMDRSTKINLTAWINTGSREVPLDGAKSLTLSVVCNVRVMVNKARLEIYLTFRIKYVGIRKLV